MDASPFCLPNMFICIYMHVDTCPFESVFIHPCTMSYSRLHTRVRAYINTASLFANLFPGSCHAIPVLAHFLFCWSLSNCLLHPAVLRRLSIFIAQLAYSPARLLPCEDFSICPVVPFHGNIVAWNSLWLLFVQCLPLVNLITSICRPRLPMFSQPSAALGCRPNKVWALSLMPKQRPLVPNGSSRILPLRVPPSSAAYSFSLAVSHTERDCFY